MLDPALAASSKRSADNMLHVIYDNGPVGYQWENFDQVRARVEREWNELPAKADVISPELMAKVKEVGARIRSAAAV